MIEYKKKNEIIKIQTQYFIKKPMRLLRTIIILNLSFIVNILFNTFLFVCIYCNFVILVKGYLLFFKTYNWTFKTQMILSLSFGSFAFFLYWFSYFWIVYNTSLKDFKNVYVNNNNFFNHILQLIKAVSYYTFNFIVVNSTCLRFQFVW